MNPFLLIALSQLLRCVGLDRSLAARQQRLHVIISVRSHNTPQVVSVKSMGVITREVTASYKTIDWREEDGLTLYQH
jgi:hypothetical protein